MKIFVFTGAGISASAGIATYRDSGTSWRDPELEKKSHSSEYGNHLDELWDKHWGPMSIAMEKAEPTYAHKVLARLQDDHDVVIATQNIDGLHQRAGSENVIELHGNMDIRRCKANSPVLEGLKYKTGEGGPLDERGKKTKPNVVLFGEPLSSKKTKKAFEHAGNADVILSIGTSLNVFPASLLVMDYITKSFILNKDALPFMNFAAGSRVTTADEGIDEFLFHALSQSKPQ